MQGLRHAKTGVLSHCVMSDVIPLVRCFSLSSSASLNEIGKFLDGRRMVRMMKKLMKPPQQSIRHVDQHHPSKQLLEFGFIHKPKTSIAGINKPASGKLLRRTKMLDNLFVEHITGLLATEEVVPGFIGLGIQISEVKIAPDFSAVNVYWYASGTERDEEIQQLLAKNAGHIRHSLTQLRVLGIVPPINFLQDKTFSKLQEIEMLLAKCSASQGEAHDSDDQTNALTVETADICNEKMEPVIESKSAVEDTMRQDILGLRHDLIMQRIQKSLQRKTEKKRAREQSILEAASMSDENIENECTSSDTTPLETESTDYRARQQEFLKYLKKKQLEKSKEMYRLSVEAKNKEFYSDEKEARRNQQLCDYLDELDVLEEEHNDYETIKYNDEEDAYYNELKQSFK